MERLPESRLIALRASEESEERAFMRQAQKPPPKSRLVPFQIGSTVPLKTAAISWPTKTSALCLHCAEACPSVPLPAVKYFDSHEEKYWVYGFFCRPCCALAYVQEHPTTDTARCLMWTQAVLRQYFQIKHRMTPAPPRAALSKFGGSLSLKDFYGQDGFAFKMLHTPPFVTFAMYAELNEVDTVDSKVTHGLRRPVDSKRPVAQPEPTEKPPLILEYLARRGLSLKPQEKVSDAKKRKSDKEQPSGSLAKYLIK